MQGFGYWHDSAIQDFLYRRSVMGWFAISYVSGVELGYALLASLCAGAQ